MTDVPKTYEEALIVIEQLLSKIVDLETRLEKAEARAVKAEAKVAELEKRLEKYEKKPSPDPATPSGMIPPYKKPNRKKGRKKKVGRKTGHTGTRRKKPDRVDNHAYHSLTCCPDCGSTNVNIHETVTRYTEEIPPVRPIVTEHTKGDGAMLQRMGYTIDQAKDGQEACLLFSKAEEAGRSYAACLLDLTIPGGMGGKEAASEMRTFNPDVILIASSGYSGDPVIASPTENGFSASIVKPFRKVDLAELMANISAVTSGAS